MPCRGSPLNRALGMLDDDVIADALEGKKTAGSVVFYLTAEELTSLETAGDYCFTVAS